MPKLKCKPGDIALVVEPGASAPDRSGLLVEVLRLAVPGGFEYGGERFIGDQCPGWVVRSAGGGMIDSPALHDSGKVFHRQNLYSLIYDKHLFPLPGEEDARDVDVGRVVEVEG